MSMWSTNTAWVNCDTVTDPDDTTVLAAPGAGSRIYLHWVSFTVSTAEAATGVFLEGTIGGTAARKFAGASCAALGSTLVSFADSPMALDANTALNATTEGGTSMVVTVTVGYTIRS